MPWHEWNVDKLFDNTEQTSVYVSVKSIQVHWLLATVTIILVVPYFSLCWQH